MNEGKYTMRATAGGLGKTKSGNPQIGVELMVSQGDGLGERITWYGYFTDASKDITFRTLRTLGWEGDDLSNLAGIDKNEVTVYLKEEEWEGKWSLKVKGIYPLGGAGIANPMSDAEAKSFAAVMKGDAIASRTGSGSKTESGKPRPKSKAKPPPDNARMPADDQPLDDDIPF
jgi:hypothetical protein